MESGKITTLKDKFGFIRPDVAEDGTKDMFFHCSALSDGVDWYDLVEGMVVEFRREKNDRGPKAADVTPLEGE